MWSASRNKILQRAITAVTKSANHLNKEAEDRKAAAGQQEQQEVGNTATTATATAAAEEEDRPKSLPELLKQCSRDAVTLMMQTALHPGQNARPLPNPWAGGQ
jgi:hypothetical protein